jgi:cellulose synthase/poly-beta-1,6-N-acetylglucosamine synthase-like glycosyltransferase
MPLLSIATIFAGLHVLYGWANAWRAGRQARSRPVATPPLPTPAPLVSVLVPAWCERSMIGSCIAALGTVAYPRWEVIVIAGGPDATYQAALAACQPYVHMRVIEQTPHGKNAALNAGLRLAQGSVIVILDADSEVEAGWLAALVAALHEPIGAVCGQPVARRITAISRHEALEQLVTWRVRGAIMLQGSGSIAVRRELLAELGGFPEQVSVGVDWDLGARLVARSVQLAQTPLAVVRTERPASLGEYWRNELRWRRAHLRWLLRQPAQARSLAALLQSLYPYCLAWAGGLALLLILALALSEHPATVPTLSGTGLLASWVLLRSTATVVAAIAYSNDWRWLQLVWTPPLLQLCSSASIIMSTLTLRNKQIHFKGPRPGKEQYG